MRSKFHLLTIFSNKTSAKNKSLENSDVNAYIYKKCIYTRFYEVLKKCYLVITLETRNGQLLSR